MASIFDTPGGDADTLNRKDYLLREEQINNKYGPYPEEKDKRLKKLFKDYLKDKKLAEDYGEDAMKSKGFNSPNRPQTPGVYRAMTDDEKAGYKKKKRGVTKKAKGGSVRAFNNGGAVMSGRGPKFKGIT